jgi:hypothetical protein
MLDHGLPIEFDQAGKPLIKSMRPMDPDPWNGQIISFDLSLLLGIEIGEIANDPDDASEFSLPVRILSDRSRLVLTPISGSNSTMVPSAGEIKKRTPFPPKGIVTFFAGLERVGPTNASTLSTVEPAVTVALAAWVLGEAISFMRILGGIMIIVAVIILARSEASRPSP